MKVAICDDNPIFAEQVNDFLDEYDPALFETYTYYNPENLLKQVETENFDFFILDIEMQNINGVELAKNIRDKGILSPIVFLTSYKEYMEEVFEVQTFDYLLKPIDKSRLFQVLEKLKVHINKADDVFLFSINKNTFRIPTNNIVYFEKDKRQVVIHTLDCTYRAYMSTKQILEQLGSSFVQIHSSFIINCLYIKELGNNFLLLNYNQKSIELPISRRYKTKSHESIIMSMRGKL